MRKVLILLALATSALANDRTVTSMQSGSTTTPLHDRGIHGEGQVIAILDTGADWTSCFFAEPDGSRPPVNTGSPGGGLEWQHVDLTRRKIVAYNFLYSCDQYPGAPGCEDPSRPSDYDNARHGTVAAGAAAGDRGTPIVHDPGDAIAPGAKLVIQDGGFIGGDACSHRPGFGCPVKLTPILDQAYKQGVRIHSNSWGDRQGVLFGVIPTANYPQSAYDVDAFVWSHPDLLVVFNTGNYQSEGLPPASSLSAPGAAKNTLQVGGTRGYARRGDNILAGYSLTGPTRDGRIKPDVVGPAYVYSADTTGSDCDASHQGGTSWASPSVAGGAALVRQYYTEGFYPSGTRRSGDAFAPSAALLKATIIAAAREVPKIVTGNDTLDAEPVPSFQQGWGFPVLDDALFFAGDRREMRIRDVPLTAGIAVGETFTTTVQVEPGIALKAVLVWTDPPGHIAGVSDTSPQLVNDLDLRIVTPAGLPIGRDDHLNNVEVVDIPAPAAGVYTITVSAPRIGFGPRQSFALVITGDFSSEPARRRVVRR